MTGAPSIDVAYGYAQLGIPQGAALSDIRAVLTCAESYAFFTKQRLEHVRRLVAFFEAREKLGGYDVPFQTIKKQYRRDAMRLHPDRTRGDGDSENRLKDVNALYAQVEDVHRSAKEYYKENESIRAAIEKEAREATERERPARAKSKRAGPGLKREQSSAAKPGARTSSVRKGDIKYLAAAVPRSVRTARLGYLPVQTIIGSKVTPQDRGINYIFDIIMLPEDQFTRARSYLSSPEIVIPALQYGKFAPPYTLNDIHELTVPADVAEPDRYARDYFKNIFKLL